MGGQIGLTGQIVLKHALEVYLTEAEHAEGLMGILEQLWKPAVLEMRLKYVIVTYILVSVSLISYENSLTKLYLHFAD